MVRNHTERYKDQQNVHPGAKDEELVRGEPGGFALCFERSRNFVGEGGRLGMDATIAVYTAVLEEGCAVVHGRHSK